MNLEDLIAELIQEGYSPKEAAKVAAATLRAQERTGTLAKSEDDLSFPASPQNDGRPAVNYGNESAAQAKERWMEQEMNDPQGVFSGGMSGGGVFGGDVVATDTYDPTALHRTMDIQDRRRTAEVQNETLRTLRELRDQQNNQGLPSGQPRRRLGNSFSRLLGKKKQR